jgi:hypothetical protein
MSMTEPDKKNHHDSHPVHHLRHFRKTTLTSLILSILVTGVSFMVFFQMAPRFEKELVPSIQLLENIQKEHKALTQSLNELQKKAVSYDQSVQQTAALKAQVVGLQETLGQVLKNLADVQDKVGRPQAAATQPAGSPNPISPAVLKEKWVVIQNRYQKGDIFSEILHELIPSLGSDKALLDSLHQLTVHANAPVKTLPALIQELLDIRHTVEKGKVEESHENSNSSGSILGWIKQKLKGLVSITLEEDLSALEKNKDAQKAFLAMVDKTVKDLQSNNLKAALDHIKPLAHEHPALLGGWVEGAEKRLAFDDAFVAFKNKFESFLVRVS